MRLLETFARVAIVIQILAVLALLCRSAPMMVRDIGAHAVEMGWTLVWVALAFALRWGLADHAFVHENNHSYAFAPHAGFYAMPHGLPSSTLILSWISFQITGLGEIDFAMNAGLSSAAVGGAYAAVRIVTGSVLGATTAAAMLALQPLAIFLAPTEEYMVTATGLVLLGLPAILYGGRQRNEALTAIGVLLVCLAASVRDIALPTAAMVLPVWLACRSVSDTSRREWGILLGIPLLTLMPRTLLLLIATRSHDTSFMNLPHLILIKGGGVSQWAGWTSPWIAPWYAVAACLAVAWVSVQALKGSSVAFRAFVVPWIIAFVPGGLPVAGSFPFFLRHQALAMALLVLPLGAAIAGLAPAIDRRLRHGSALTVAALIAAASLWLLVHPEATRPHLPSTQEYVFLSDILPTLPEEAYALDLSDVADGIPHIGATVLHRWHPRWQVESLEQLTERAAAPSTRPTYFVLERSCFRYDPCKETQRACDELFAEATETLRETPWGWVLPKCKRALDAVPWREVGHVRIETAPWLTRTLFNLAPRSRSGIHIDMPPVTPFVDVALLRWDGGSTAPSPRE